MSVAHLSDHAPRLVSDTHLRINRARCEQALAFVAKRVTGTVSDDTMFEACFALRDAAICGQALLREARCLDRVSILQGIDARGRKQWRVLGAWPLPAEVA